jgi:acyl-coenzyme A thioesterase PaaI-like protein
MANIQRYSGDEAILRSSNVDFRRPVSVGEPVIVTARVVNETPNGWHLPAVLTNEFGRRLASATGEAIRPKQSDPA